MCLVDRLISPIFISSFFIISARIVIQISFSPKLRGLELFWTTIASVGCVLRTLCHVLWRCWRCVGRTLHFNAIKLRNIVGWVGAIPCGCPRNIVMGRPTHHCYKFTPGSSFQRVGGCSEALPTLQKKLNLMALTLHLLST